MPLATSTGTARSCGGAERSYGYPMRRRLSTSAAVAACCALLLVPVLPAAADDATPTPTASATPSPSTTPEPATPTNPTTPTTPVTPTNPTTPTVPAVDLPRRELPLKKGHFGHLVDVAQERLAWLGYDIADANLERQRYGESTQAAVKKFQAKFWLPQTGVVDRKTWNTLREMANPLGVLPLRCTEVSISLCADKTTRLIRLVVKGKVKLTLDARFGLPGMDTGEGVFSVNRKSRDHVSSLYRTWMPFALFFNGGEAVHYSPFFAADGYNGGSHGCIGTRDIKMAEWLFDRVPMGARVYVYRS